MNNSKYRRLFYAILLMLTPVICFAQDTPKKRALNAIRKANSCLDECSTLNCSEQSLREYEKIKKDNPKLNLPAHNLNSKLRAMKKSCLPKNVAKSGGTTGTTIIGSIPIIVEYRKAKFAYSSDKILTKIEKNEIASRLKDLRKRQKSVSKDSAEFREMHTEEKQLKEERAKLDADLTKKKKEFKTKYGFQFKLVLFYLKLMGAL